VDEREIRITGRIKQFLSLVGEHLSLDNINAAIQRTSEITGVDIPEFSLHADTENQRHVWYIGTNDRVDANVIMQTIDEQLAILNDDYASVRKYNLNTPDIHVLPVDCFYAYMDSIGKAGSQNKFPRVLNATQSISWKHFIQSFN
jgi:hypothetical protein